MIDSGNVAKHTSPPVLSVRDLYKVYEMGDIKVNALNGVSFNVYPGDFVAIMGQSGSGKTTLLNVISGLDSITSGSIYVEGKDIANMKDKELTTIRRTRMGFIFQSYLAYAEIVWLKAMCPLCLVSHIILTIIVIYAIFNIFKIKKIKHTKKGTRKNVCEFC